MVCCRPRASKVRPELSNVLPADQRRTDLLDVDQQQPSVRKLHKLDRSSIEICISEVQANLNLELAASDVPVDVVVESDLAEARGLYHWHATALCYEGVREEAAILAHDGRRWTVSKNQTLLTSSRDCPVASLLIPWADAFHTRVLPRALWEPNPSADEPPDAASDVAAPFSLRKSTAGLPLDGDLLDNADLLDVGWRRGAFLFKGETMVLYKDVQASDVRRGGKDVCGWLLGAMAVAADIPDFLETVVFANGEQTLTSGQAGARFLCTEDGKYSFRLWSPHSQRVEVVLVDDWLPVKRSCHTLREREYYRAQPELLFSQPSENQLWVPLLEKAVAKLLGSYKELEANQARRRDCLMGLALLTGKCSEKNETCFRWQKEASLSWKKSYLRWGTQAGTEKVIYESVGETKKSNELWDLIKIHQKQNRMMVAEIQKISSPNAYESTDYPIFILLLHQSNYLFEILYFKCP